ncbi:hypothetical protein ACTA71_005221 [Dictyostelium dimigraforme]
MIDEELLKKYIGEENFKSGCIRPSKYKDSIQYADDLIEFINKYSFLYENRSLDFFRNNIWERLIPEDWKQPLLEMTDEECVEFHCGTIIKDEWPIELKSFINDAVNLWIPKNVYLPDDQWILQDTKKDFGLDSLFLGMSGKKIHEILRMSEFVNMIAKQLKPNEIVDIGAGEAYLTQILNHQFNHSMTAIDCSESFIEGAIKRQTLIENQRIKKELKQQKENENEKDNLNKITSTITTTRSTTATINNNNNNNKLSNNNETILNEIKKVKEIEKKEIMNKLNVKSTNMCVTTISTDMKNDDFLDILNGNDSRKNYESIMLIGLHTCGILPPTMIKNYLQCSNIDSIIDVGCCYYKIDIDSNHQFMSDHCIGKNLKLGPAPLKLSCEASDSSQKDLESFKYSGRIHYYRVILEDWILNEMNNNNNNNNNGNSDNNNNNGGKSNNDSDNKIKSHDFTIRNISKNQCKDYKSYYNAALIRMKRQQKEQLIHQDFKFPETCQPIISYFEKQNQIQQEKKISVFLLLRSLLAPVLESIIVLDRFLYLDQFSSTTQSFIIPIFNKLISPRNLIILSFKNKIK